MENITHNKYLKCFLCNGTGLIKIVSCSPLVSTTLGPVKYFGLKLTRY